jgi:hypothetical protein
MSYRRERQSNRDGQPPDGGRTCRRRTLGRRTLRRGGTATVELSVCLPVLVLIVVGAIETCSFIHLNESLTTASYEAARVMAMPTATRSEGVRRCREFLASRNIDKVVVTTNPADLDSLDAGKQFTVIVSVPMVMNNRILASTVFANRNIQKSMTFVKE